MKKSLSAYNLKLIAITAMVLDHLVYIINFLPIGTAPAAYLSFFLCMAGRITMPVMCFFISEGYYHTKNLKKYFMKLFIFAVISQLPYYFYFVFSGFTTPLGFIKANILNTNVLVTLFLGLCALTLAKSENIHSVIKVIGVLICILLSKYSDWSLYGVIWVLVFGLFRGSPKKQFGVFSLFVILRAFLNSGNSILNLILQLSCLLALIPLSGYNGGLGKKSGFLFYIFYPAHLAVLAIIRYILI